jgi:glycosidase
MASEMNKALYGEEVAKKMDAVTIALEEVNQKHKEYFADIKSRFKEDEPSSLSEFTILQWNSQGASFSASSELRPDIAEEARQAFSKAVNS